MHACETFPEAVRDQLAFLLDDHGFRQVDESGNARLGVYSLRFESKNMGAEAIYERGAIEVAVFRLGHEQPYEKWSYIGMVGRASVQRVLQMAAEQLLAEKEVLRGDSEYFERLTHEQHAEAEQWIAYRAGTGPHPRPGKLPRPHPASGVDDD